MTDQQRKAAWEAWRTLEREQQKAETKALTPRFLDYLEALASESHPDDRPPYHEELIAEIRRLRADVEGLKGNLVKMDQANGIIRPGSGLSIRHNDGPVLTFKVELIESNEEEFGVRKITMTGTATAAEQREQEGNEPREVGRAWELKWLK